MNAVIIYDEFDLAANSHGVLRKAANRADDASLWSIKPWRLDMLIRPPTAHAALKDAAEAHLIVLAVRSQADLSPRLLDWLEKWALCRQVEDAALAVFDGGNGETFSASASPTLLQFAERHGLSFIFGGVRPRDGESERFLGELHEREVAQTPTMAHILEQSRHDYYQGWSINE